MSDSSDNKRIAKNSAFLYIRMLFVMCVAFYVSRIVLEALGVVNFGIYNVVGGLSAAFVFFSNSLTGTTQRYLNVEMGKNDPVRIRKIFNVSLILFSGLALVILTVGVFLGRWIVENVLVIPAANREAGVMVLYATSLSLAATFVFSVYESVLIARENMKIYAYLGIVDGLAKLGVAFIIMHVPNRLVVYAWLLAAVQIFPRLFIAVYCRLKYTEVRHKWVWEKKLVKEFMGFSFWLVYESTVWTINDQGINVILNIFFGPVINAARGVAAQVNNAIYNFVTNFFMAVKPQIIKRYAMQEMESMESLVFSSTRISWYLFLIFVLPLSLRVNYILGIWLTVVPEYSAIFVVWTLIYTMINAFNIPIWTALSATGNMKRAGIIGCNLFLLAFPLSYLALKLHAPAWSVYPILCLGRLALLFNTIQNFSRYSSITIKSYFRKAFYPIFLVTAIALGISFFFNSFIPDNLWGLIVFFVISAIFTVTIAFSLGVPPSERIVIISFIKNKLHKK